MLISCHLFLRSSYSLMMKQYSKELPNHVILQNRHYSCINASASSFLQVSASSCSELKKEALVQTENTVSHLIALRFIVMMIYNTSNLIL